MENGRVRLILTNSLLARAFSIFETTSERERERDRVLLISCVFAEISSRVWFVKRFSSVFSHFPFTLPRWYINYWVFTLEGWPTFFQVFMLLWYNPLRISIVMWKEIIVYRIVFFVSIWMDIKLTHHSLFSNY